MSERIRLGISPCPNDTFAFHGLLTGRVDARGLDLDFEIADVEELNRRALAGELDASKVSSYAALRGGEELVLLPVGAAVGFGVGPLLLAPARAGPGTGRILCPGELTTATLLLRLFHPAEGAIEQVPFSEILPALERGEADLGVCIHEGRFVWRERGLRLVEDLGERWERETGLPLVLGGIAARRELGPERLARLSGAIRDSIDHAHGHRAQALETMRAHAQEHSERVLWAHVELYVGEGARALPEEGRAALVELERRARAAGLLPEGAPGIVVLGR